MTNRILVVYYSLTGNTARVARDIASRVQADVESLKDPGHGLGVLSQFTNALDAWRKAPARIEAPLFDPAGYAVTVIGTPVWAWRLTPAVRSYLSRMQGHLGRVAFFVTSGDTDVDKLVPGFAAAAGVRPFATAGFNAQELADATLYERKIAALADAVNRAAHPAQRVA